MEPTASAAIYGIDFSSTPQGGGGMWLAAASLSGRMLTVTRMARLEDHRAFEEFLGTDGPWVCGADFPFGQPRQFIADLHYANTWSDYVAQFASHSRAEFETLFTTYKAERPDGKKELFRVVDRRAQSQSPMKQRNAPVALMFYEGARRLRETNVNVPVLRPTAADRTVVEAYPALVARALVGKASYKSGEPSRREGRRAVRQTIVAGLQSRALQDAYGFAVRLSESDARRCVEDARADALDAVLCAVQAAWAWSRRDRNWGIPVDCDPLEGWIVDPFLIRGQWNSSITRVRPFFQELLARPPEDARWLGDLLRAVPNQRLGPELATNAGRIDPGCLVQRPYADRILGSISLPSCFESKAPPPEAFLRWLILNADRRTLSWPKETRYSEATQKHREDLFGDHGAEAQKEAKDLALIELVHRGAAGSDGRWWAFEGFTEIDCRIETDRLVLVVEGKRTESLSQSIGWYSGRNQLHRNLEVARQLANGRRFAVLILAETPLPDSDLGSAARGLPHLEAVEREALMGHFLGTLTWEAACQAVGIPFASLPIDRWQRDVG